MQYWPTPAPAGMKNRTTLVGPDGFTYTSPSVYVVYKGISATNDCGQTLGSTTVDLTLSYAPSDMTTFSNRVDGYTYKTIDFATIWSNCSERYTYSSEPDPPCAKTITTEEANCVAQISSIGANALFWREHCYPQLSFPPTTRLQELNTAWKMCDMGNVDTSILGVFDPPRALKSGTAMVAPVPTKTPDLPTPPIAEPASQAVPSQPEKTASPSTAQASNDPSSNINLDPSGGAGSPNQGGAVDVSTAGNAPLTQTLKEQDPQQAGDAKATVPASINAAPADSPAAIPPIANSPGTNQPATNNQPTMNDQPAINNQHAAKQSPSDPGVESTAQMSALHQALVPAPAASPLSQGTPQQVAGPPANAPAPVNSPAGNGGSLPAKPAPNQNQGVNPPSNGPASGGSQPASGGSQPGSGGSQLSNGVSQPAGGGSQPVVPAQNQSPSPPSNGAASNGGSPAEQAAQNQGPSPSSPVPAASAPPQFAIPIANGETLSGAVINPNSVIIAGSSGGATVQVGGPATQILGHTISIGPAVSTAIIDGQVHALTMQTPAAINNNNNKAGVTPESSHGIPVPADNPQNHPIAGPDSQAQQPNAGGQGTVVVVPPQPFTTTIADHAIAAIPFSPGAILVDGQTVSHGAPHLIISNTPVAYNSNGNLVLGTQTVSNIVPSIAPSQSPPITATIANHAIAVIPSFPSALLVDGQTISQGSGPTTISNTPIVYHPNGDLVLGSQTISSLLPSIASPPSAAASAVFTVAGQVASVLPNNAGIAIAGATLFPNAPAVAFSGTVSASYGSAGLVVGTSTIALPSQSPAIAAPTVLTVAGQVATVLPNNAGIAIAGTALQASGPAVSISGTVSASYGSAGLVVGTATAAIPSQLPFQQSLTSITLAGQVFTYAVSATRTTSADLNGVVMGTSAIPYTSTDTNGAIISGTSTRLYISAVIETSNKPFTSTGANGALFTGMSTAFYTTAVQASGSQNVGGLILGGLNPSGPGNSGLKGANGTQAGVPTTSNVAGPTGLVGASGADSKGQAPVGGVGKRSVGTGALWMGTLMIIICVL